MKSEFELKGAKDEINGAIALFVNSGYKVSWETKKVGNVKQAAKEFGEKLKEVFNSKHWAVFANAANKDIDNLITELYGADE